MLNLTKGRLLSVVCALIFAPTLFAQSSVKLSELMASNLSLIDTNGAITDWVELVNESSAAVDLTGVSFSDDEFNPTKWSFPPGSSIKANGYLVVAFDPNRAPSEVVEPVLNTGFGIKATRMNLFLFGVNF